jgi:hypothetical protein
VARTSRIALAAVVAAALGSHAARAGDLVGLAPDGAASVVVVDVAAARGSALFTRPMLATIMEVSPAATRLGAAGIDPMTAFDAVVIADVGTPSRTDWTVVVAEGPGVARAAAALTPARPAAAASGTFDGVAFTTTTDASFAVVGGRLIVTTPPGRAGIEPAIAAARGRDGLAARSSRSARLRAVIDATDRRQHLWVATVLPADTFASLHAAGVAAPGLSIGVTFAARARLDVRAVAADAAGAAAVERAIRGQLRELHAWLTKGGLGHAARTVRITRRGRAVRATATLSAAELTALATAVVGLAASSVTFHDEGTAGGAPRAPGRPVGAPPPP